jgi:two-component system sensor histidine kinase PhoQ
VSRSITRRLLSSNLLILCAFLGLAGVALDRAFRSSSESAARERLQAHVYTLLTAAKEDPQGRMRLPTDLTVPAFNRPDSGLYAAVESHDRSYRWRSGSLLGRKQLFLRKTRIGQTRFALTDDLAVFDQGIAWEDDLGRETAYTVSVAIDNHALETEQDQFRGTLWSWLGGVAFVLLIAQTLLARWGLAPLHDMSHAVRRIENGSADEIEGPVPSELAGLSSNLNSLIRQSQSRQARVRNSLADLAHSLKTPLAVLRGAVDRQRHADLGRLIDEQTRRIDEIVSYQRQRAIVAGSSGITRPIALAPIVARLCTSLDKVHRERGIACRRSIASELRLRADEGDLFELLGNLLENAYKHCAAQIQVSAKTSDGLVQITVDDDGEGFASADRERLLMRGERADQRHPGEGLGLAVASEIARQYGGGLNLLDSPLGGARVRVSLKA